MHVSKIWKVIRPKTYLKLLSDEFCISLGTLSEVCGERPSSLLGWVDSDDAAERLKLDINIMNLYGLWQKKKATEGE